MDPALKSGVEMMVCNRSVELLGIDKGDIIEGKGGKDCNA